MVENFFGGKGELECLLEEKGELPNSECAFEHCSNALVLGVEECKELEDSGEGNIPYPRYYLFIEFSVIFCPFGIHL